MHLLHFETHQHSENSSIDITGANPFTRQAVVMSSPDDTDVKREYVNDALTPDAMSDVRSELSPKGDDTDNYTAAAFSSVKIENSDVKRNSSIPSEMKPKLRAGSASSSSSSNSWLRGEFPGSSSRDKVKTERIGGDITVKMEPGQPPKLSRSTSHKVIPRAPPLFNHLPDATEEATSSFQVIDACTYTNKWMGYTEHGMECDCSEEWGKS